VNINFYRTEAIYVYQLQEIVQYACGIRWIQLQILWYTNQIVILAGYGTWKLMMKIISYHVLGTLVLNYGI
jgi:hypothetical protein